MADGKLTALPPEMSVKQPLRNSWTLWFLENDPSRAYEENLVEVDTFSTADDFWSLYNRSGKASELKPGMDYFLFKKGMKPICEDPGNRSGGRWFFLLNTVSGSSDQHHRDRLDVFWLDLMLLLVKEGFGDAGETVCGAQVAIRKQHKKNKIFIWTGDAERLEDITKIGQRLKELLLCFNPDITIQYFAFSDWENQDKKPYNSSQRPRPRVMI